MITLLLDMDETEKADEELASLGKLQKEVKTKEIEQLYQIANALILKKSDRIRDLGKAEEILTKVIEEKIDIRFSILALVNLCELLLMELKYSSSTEILDEINNYIEMLLVLAEKQQSYVLFAETYLLQAQIALIELDIKKAKELLGKALEISTKYGLKNLIAEIESEQKKLTDKLDIWKKLVDEKASITETLQHVDTDATMKRIQIESSSETSKTEPILIKELFSLKL